jgi:hypothetical protein
MSGLVPAIDVVIFNGRHNGVDTTPLFERPGRGK